ncbi:prepilin-type N-terminal cleavage/methylation domain-containing protein [Candidatus Gracilibacteria bacterium]|nr:prepilin-type N-terminal cleavage/methylation domain-containing protein [Candidatus Gracilibacteria bacterium]
MKKLHTSSGFTLIEIIVTVTIISIVLVSVIASFIAIQNITHKNDMYRSIHENIKTLSQALSHDIHRSTLVGVSLHATDPYTFGSGGKYGTALETANNRYYLAQKNELSGDWERVEVSHCQSVAQHCSLYQRGVGPLTNNRVSVSDIAWYISAGNLPKVTLVIEIRPAAKRGLSSSVLEKATQVFQMTFSERILSS